MTKPPLYGWTGLGETTRVIAWMYRLMALMILLIAPAKLFAGGSGLNVAVVVNQNSTNSVQLGNYYCEKRGVPPQNLLRINWTGGIVEWSRSEFTNTLLNPLVTMLASRQLTNQIDYVVLSMDIPYRVYNGGIATQTGTNSTTAALHYGFKTDFTVPGYDPASCNLPAASFSAYAGSEGIFRQTPPISANSNSWLVMMLTSSNLAQAKAVVDRGVVSDASFPTQTVYLIHFQNLNYTTADPFRDIRYPFYDDVVFDSRLRSVMNVSVVNAYAPYVPGYQLGSEFGLSGFGIYPNYIAPGGMADNLTSYGGLIFEAGHHSGPIEYLYAGAAASYGTVVEPCNHYGKFPVPRNYFFQSRGFTVAECYYQSVTNPYQGLLLGEPLAAPFALPGSGSWSNLPPGAPLAGTTNLTVQFTAPDVTRPVQQVDLFLNGAYSQTLTNIAPRQNNKLYISLNGQTTNYTVPASATLKSLASNLTAVLNTASYSNATKVAALAHGDRIELRSLDLNARGSQVSLSVSNDLGTATALTTFLTASRTNFLDTTAYGLRNYLVTNTVLAGNFLHLAITKTNGASVMVGVTNASGTTADLVEALVNAVNTNASLMGDDGLLAENFISYDYWMPFYGYPGGEFSLRARSPGWPESQMDVTLTKSINLASYPSGTKQLDENVADLQPRNHLYVTAGATNLTLAFPLNTTTNADGFHELTAVAYEGSHVRTQTRTTQSVRITNSTLTATFDCLLGGTNTALEATLQFAVVANTNTILSVVLYTTGGAQATVSNLATANFSLAATNLGIGLHPFYALVTRNDGKQYRTETKWIRIIGAESPFTLGIVGSAPTVIWPATAGRRYEILSATNATNILTLRDAVTPTNSSGLWSETNNAAAQRLYRVRAVP